MGDREVKQPPAGHFWKQKTDVPDHAKQEGNDWIGPPREHSVRFPGLTLVVASQRPHCCMEQRVTHWEVLTGTVRSEDHTTELQAQANPGIPLLLGPEP